MRLIDAGALAEFLLKEIIECDKEYDEKSDHIFLGARQEAELIRDKVKEMPMVDTVRCKDCKYWDVDNDVGFCTRTEDCDWSADDFCSKGVKR